MTPTESKILERVIEIDPNNRYIAVVSSTNQAALEDAIPYLEKLLSNWWLSESPFLVLGKSDGVDIVFHKVGTKDNEETLRQ